MHLQCIPSYIFFIFSYQHNNSFEMASNSQASIDSSQSNLWPTSIQQSDANKNRSQLPQQAEQVDNLEAGKTISDHPNHLNHPSKLDESISRQNKTGIQVKDEQAESLLIEPNTLSDHQIGQTKKQDKNEKQQNDSSILQMEAKPNNKNLDQEYNEIWEKDAEEQDQEEKSEGVKQNTITNIPLKPKEHPKYRVEILEPVHHKNQQYSNIPEQLYRPYVAVLDQLDSLHSKTQRFQGEQRQIVYEQIANIIWSHIQPKMHPQASNELGRLLLSNGKFVVRFIEASHRKYEKDKEFLKLYLYEHFKKQGNIQNDILTFNQQYLKIKAAELSILYPNLDQQPLNDDCYLNQSVIAVKDKDEEMAEISDLIHSEDTDGPQNKTYKQADQPNRPNKLKREKVVEQHDDQKLYVEQNKPEKRKSTKRKIKNSRQLESLKKKRKNGDIQKQLATESVQTQDSNKKLGSYYSYKLQVDKKDHLKNLRQVRTSARLTKKKNERASRSKYKNQRKSKGKKSGIKLQQSQISQSQYQPSSSAVSIQANSDDESIEQIVEVDWIKKHLPEINVQQALMYKEFKAMTKEDKKITEFLLSLEEEDKGEEKKQKMKIDDQVSQNIKKIFNGIHSFSGNDSNDQLPPNKQSTKPYSSYRIEELPLTIEQVIDPNINNHNIYALLKLSKLSSLEMGTRYVVTRLTKADMANRRHILEDLQKAKNIVGQPQGQNLGYIQLNGQILKMIDEKKKEDAQN